MTRPMTPVEKTEFRQYFPQMDVDRAVVSGEVSSVCNCISWTVGVTNRWLWPGSSISDFGTFYRGWGFVRSSNGPIAAFGLSTSDMKHGSVSGAGHGPRWESKCGPNLRIQHGLGEMEGGVYGRVVAFYAKSLAVDAPSARLVSDAFAAVPGADSLRLNMRDLAQIVDKVDRDTAKSFENRFEAWKGRWFAGAFAVDSNPYSRTSCKEFSDLVELGQGIIPLVVQKLTQPDNFMALALYEALQTDPKLLVQYDSADERLLEGEQGRAIRVVQAYLRNS